MSFFYDPYRTRPLLVDFHDEYLTFRYGSLGNRYGSDMKTLQILVSYPINEVVVFVVDENMESTEWYAQVLKERYQNMGMQQE